MNIISAKNLNHSYIVNGKRHKTLKDISFDIKQGELVAVIGKNGSGKSTLVRHINRLIELQAGELTVMGYFANEIKNTHNIRKHCAMVFQNPDNQFVSEIVEEDIKFGLKNFNLDYSSQSVADALSLVGLSGYEKRSIRTLSGGEKQRVALAGVLAVNPDIIILDEATSMLPPLARENMLGIINDLHKKTSITFIMITQYLEETLIADRVMLMKNGKILSFDSSENVLTNEKLLSDAGLTPPFSVRLFNDLKNAGIPLGGLPANNKELVNALCQLK